MSTATNLKGNRNIRRATESDAVTIQKLMNEFAYTQKSGDLLPPSEPAHFRLKLDAFGPNPPLELWLIENEEHEAIGYAAILYTYSTFEAKPTLYLEDIFILPEYQNQGLGTKVMEYFIQIAVEKNCGRMEWVVHRNKTQALALYRHFHAQELTDWIPCRLNRQQLEAIAQKIS